MKFCNKLFTDINFEPHLLSPCCNTQNITIPAFRYEGGKIDLEAYSAHIANIITGLQNDGNICKNCSDLTEIGNLPPMDGKFKAVSLNMHRYYCNCKCVYCSLWKYSEKGKGYNPLPGLMSLHDAGALSQSSFISWGGGESTILESFEQTATWALNHGYLQNVHTNALKYSSTLRNILAHNGYINVSLDSGNKATYLRVKGVNGFNHVYNNLSKYAAVNPDNIILKYIIFENNNSKQDINDFINIVLELGVSNIEFSLNFLELNSNTVSRKTLYAVAYMIMTAHRKQLKLAPFFIPPKWQAKISSILDELSGKSV